MAEPAVRYERGEKERSHIAVTRDGDRDREKRMRRAPVCDAASIGSPDDGLGGQWAASLSLSLSLVTEAGSRGKRGWKEREGGRMMQSVQLADTADNAASPMNRNSVDTRT